MKTVVAFNADFETAIARYGVICGHLHEAASHELAEIWVGQGREAVLAALV